MPAVPLDLPPRGSLHCTRSDLASPQTPRSLALDVLRRSTAPHPPRANSTALGQLPHSAVLLLLSLPLSSPQFLLSQDRFGKPIPTPANSVRCPLFSLPPGYPQIF